MRNTENTFSFSPESLQDCLDELGIETSGAFSSLATESLLSLTADSGTQISPKIKPVTEKETKIGPQMIKLRITKESKWQVIRVSHRGWRLRT